MEEPKGRTLMSDWDKNMIVELRMKGYSHKQIGAFVQRSISSVKRVLYGLLQD